MPADLRPTINLGTKYRVAKATAAKAAATIRAGQKRTDEESRARVYERTTAARAKVTSGYAAETRRKRRSPSPLKMGPAARQYQYTTE